MVTSYNMLVVDTTEGSSQQKQTFNMELTRSPVISQMCVPNVPLPYWTRQRVNRHLSLSIYRPDLQSMIPCTAIDKSYKLNNQLFEKNKG